MNKQNRIKTPWYKQLYRKSSRKEQVRQEAIRIEREHFEERKSTTSYYGVMVGHNVVPMELPIFNRRKEAFKKAKMLAQKFKRDIILLLYDDNDEVFDCKKIKYIQS